MNEILNLSLLKPMDKKQFGRIKKTLKTTAYQNCIQTQVAGRLQNTVLSDIRGIMLNVYLHIH